MSQRPPISFRFTDQELEVLEQERMQSESINQTAARLLRERLGLIDVDNQSTLRQQTLETWINDVVSLKIESILHGCNEVVYKKVDNLSQRIDRLEVKFRSTRKSTSKSTTINKETTDSKTE